jgi:hypothetical protein
MKIMKKVLLGLSALCLVAFTSCKEDAASKIKDENVAQAAERDANSSKFPVLEFDKSEHDFGELEPRTNVETVFAYKNTGDAPLVITNISSSCGCTVPKDWSREPLASGGSGEFTVKFNGTGSGNVSKTVTVTANTEKGRETVKIKAFVKPDPNAPKKAAPKKVAPTQSLSPAAVKPVKSSTKPGHEGHNHD